jgi:hypothetical protein
MLKISIPKETSQTAVVTGSRGDNGDNLNNIRCETSRPFCNKKREYLREKINELANEQNKNTILRVLYLIQDLIHNLSQKI